MSENKTKILKWLGKVFLICGIVFAFVCPFSCRVTEEGIILVQDNVSCPEIESFFVTGENSARIVFDGNVSLKEASMNPVVEILSSNVETENEISTVDIVFGEALAVGETYRFYGEVRDKIGNTLTFSLPFTGYNGNVAELEITEVHPMYGSSTTKSAGTVYKCEYVEFRAVKGGNLSGLEIVSANDGEDEAYVFPALEVSCGEIIVVHLRKKDGMEAVSETGDNLALSKTFYSSDTARDLWAENDSARLGDTMDVVVLRNTMNDSVMDSVCYGLSSAENWKSDEMLDMCQNAVEDGKWDSENVSSAACSDGLTLTKSLTRMSSACGKDAWTVTATSGTNPGTVSY